LQPFGNRHRVTVVVPTLGNPLLTACVASLERQSFTGMEIVVVDNSGSGEVRRILPADTRARIIENRANAGFGGAINQAFSAYPAEFLATLNDDAEASPEWLNALMAVLDGDPGSGMAASRVLLAESDRVDSAGMLIARDGSSKQRGHNDAGDRWSQPGQALCPSGSAAIYRAAMLERTGLFDDSFFLYCEDTDLGLRGRWAGWRCPFVPTAVVRHNYSASAGRASSLKAWLVERNRLRVAVRCLPASWLVLTPFAALLRYFWHAISILEGRGKAAEYTRGEGGPLRLAAIVLRAHLDLFREFPRLWRERRAIQRSGNSSAMASLLSSHLISLREVARL
jgi:GT2 family glycosyltransferase